MSSAAKILLKGSTLSYFNIPGRGESSRLMFAILDVEYENKVVPFSEWGGLKSTVPWGGLPMLELADGRKIGQQRAILRSLGRAAGLYPLPDIFQTMRVDEILDSVEDLVQITNDTGKGMDTEAKVAARKESAEKGAIYAKLAEVDAFIAMNGKGGYAVGESLSLADVQIFSITSNVTCGFFDGVLPDTLKPFANIQGVRKTVSSHPAVKKYFADMGEDISSLRTHYRDAKDL